MVDTATAISQAGQSGGTQMRIGTVKAFDALAGTLTVTIAGTDLAGVFYNPAYLPLLGDTVAVMNSGPTWYVMGSTVNSLARTTPVGAVVVSTESTTTTTYTDLTTVGPSVTAVIGASGRCLVTVGARFAGLTIDAYMSFVGSGANTIPTSDNQSAENPSQGHEAGFTRVLLLTGLTQGSTTFTAKYRSGDGQTAFFQYRTLTVQAY